MMRAKWGATQAGCDLGVAQNTNAGHQMAPGAAELRCAFLTEQVVPSQYIFTGKHLTNSELTTMCPASRSKFEGRIHEAS